MSLAGYKKTATGGYMKVTKKVKVPKMKDTTKAGVLAVVRRMIARNMENKLIGWPVELNVDHNRSITAPDCYPLIQQIAPIDSAVGNTSQQRMGDRIKPKSLRVKGVTSFTPESCNTSQNVYVRVVIAAQKSIKVGSQVAAGNVAAAQLLRPGYTGAGNDQVPFSGSTIDLNAPINKDLFRVYYDKTFKLTTAVVSGGGVEQQPLYSHRWSYKFKQLPSALTFDEANGNWPNNFAPFVAMGYAFSDGTLDALTFTRLRQNVSSFLEFEDA